MVIYLKKEEEQKSTGFWEEYFAKQKEVDMTDDDQAFINTLLEKITDGIKELEGTDVTFPIGKFVEFDWKQRKLIYQGMPFSPLSTLSSPLTIHIFSLHTPSVAYIPHRDTKTILKDCGGETTD